MSDFETVARPYAKAVYDLASTSDATKQSDLHFWSDVLQLAAQIASDESMQALAIQPEILNSNLADLFLSVMTAAENAPEISAEVTNLIKLLAENDRLLALPAIHQRYEVLKQAAEGQVEVKVISARKLTVKQEKTMISQLKKRLGKEVNITAEIDQSLIAGAIIRAGDMVIDGSVLGRLNKLNTFLNK